MTGSAPAFVRRATARDASAAAALHVSQIPDGFLSSLGERFLSRLYRRVALDTGSTLLVAERDGATVGFVAGTADVQRLYRRFITRDGLVAAAVASPSLLRSRHQVLETLRYPKAGDRTSRAPSELEESRPSAELLAMAVHPTAQRQGVGRALVDAFLTDLFHRGVAAAVVVAGSGNHPAIGLYRSAGFRSATQVQIHEGSVSEMLIWP